MERSAYMLKLLHYLRVKRRLDDILRRMQKFEQNPEGQKIPCVIAVSGDKGSGKSTLSKRFAEHFGWAYQYTGGIMRKLAEDAKHPDFYQWFREELEKNPNLEKSIDESMRRLMETEPYIIAEGRMTPFLPVQGRRVIKILVTVNKKVGAKRLYRRKEYKGMMIPDIIEKAEKAINTERIRYQNLYGVPDHLDPNCFDIILDTSNLDPDEMFMEFCLEIFEFRKAHIEEFLAQTPCK